MNNTTTNVNWTSENLVLIGTHLSKQELEDVKASLSTLNISYTAKEHHATSHYNSLYYKIKVRKEDKRVAGEVIGKIRVSTFIESRKCPKCKTLGYSEIEKKGFWEKFYYYGTTLIQCQKCKTKFAI